MSAGAIVTAVLLGAGTFFTLVAAIGVVRLGDLFMRMHASSKASTLGAILVLVAVSVHFGDRAVTARAVLTALFLLATAPVAAHAIARAAWRSGVELDPETKQDDRPAGRR